MSRYLMFAALFFGFFASCDSWFTKDIMVACTKDADCPTDWWCAADKFCIGYKDDAAAPDALADVPDTRVGDTAAVDTAPISCAQGDACPAARPICMGNTCVECSGDSECRGEATKPFCVANQCAGCAMAAATACATSTNGAKPVCGSVGVCVQCQVDSECKDPKASFCASNQCVGCGGAGADACGKRDAKLPACGPAGLCVECGKDNQCAEATKPICNSNVCRKCAADAECVSKLGTDPGVCMAHDDGRCATSGETVFVENVTARCMNTATAGTAAVPFCGFQEGINAAKGAGKALVVLRGPRGFDRASYAGAGKLAVVGQGAALISPGAGTGLAVSGGAQIYARGVAVKGGSEQGVTVESG
jgi:hypothetical protein